MPTPSDANTLDHKVLIILLRIFGVFGLTAIVATVMPTSLIAATHNWLGLGDFPDAPITQYLARTISLFYVMFGVLSIIVSTDVKRYAPIINFLAYTCLVMGVSLTLIDAIIGMPISWTLSEGPPTIVLGIVILLLARQLRTGAAGPPQADPPV